MIRNKRFYNAINNIPQNIPPIWFMRQAGRYHSHYQSLRKKYSFIELCKNPNLASEVALGPIEDFDYDVAILFSDILFPLESLGLKLDYKPGPIFENYLRSDIKYNFDDIDTMLEKLRFQAEALQLTRKIIPKNKSLVGFVGGPWTLFSYGAAIKDKKSVENVEKNIFYEKIIYDILVPYIQSIINMQLNSGAEIVYMFDTNARQLNKNYFINSYLRNIKSEIFNIYPNKVAYFCKNNPILNNSESNKDYQLAGMVYGDHYGLSDILPKIKSGFIQGNFNPSYLLETEDIFEKNLNDFIRKLSKLSVEDRSGWICSLSHGVLPKSREKNVRSFIKTVRSVFR